MNSIENNEIEFHDEWAKSTDLSEIFVRECFESETSPENRQILKWMGELRGKKVLELGCGLGEASVYFALKGASVTATDISPGMVSKTIELAKHHGVSVEGVVVSSNSLSQLNDNEFDFVYAGNLLHHVDIEKCISMLACKIKPGGQAMFWDPVAYNPIINVYRKLASGVRTIDEHPLTMGDVKTIKKYFCNVEVRHFWLTSMSVFLWYYFFKRYNPNKVRYWKQILKDGKELSGFMKVTHRLDQFLFKVIPPLKWLSWNVAIRASKE